MPGDDEDQPDQLYNLPGPDDGNTRDPGDAEPVDIGIVNLPPWDDGNTRDAGDGENPPLNLG